MRITRREATLLATGLAFAPRVAFAESPPPALFADFGQQSSEGAVYEQAIDKGADFLVAPVISSRDGVLVVAPDNELSLFTDVAHRPEFSARMQDQVVDGVSAKGWFSEDFSLAELKSLATSPTIRGGGLRPLPPRGLLLLQDIIDMARAGSIRQGRVVGISPRLVRPAYFATRELNLEPRLADLIRLNGYNSMAAAMIVQARDPAALKALADLSSVRRVQLIDAEGTPTDPSAMHFETMIENNGLRAVAGWANAIGPVESLLIHSGAKGTILATDLARAAHQAGLAVYGRAAAPAPHEQLGALRARLSALYLAGVDGVMCADIGLAVRARGNALNRARRQGEDVY